MKYNVYQIKINNEVRYIGDSKNIVEREKQHKKAFKANLSKPFYKWLHSINYNGEIRLESIFSTKNKVEAKRYELYTILHYYFNTSPTQLKQRIPNIRDGF